MVTTLLLFALFGIPAASYLYDHFLYWRLTGIAPLAYTREERIRCIKLVEHLVRRTSLLPINHKIQLRGALGRFYLIEGRFAEAVTQLEKALSYLPRPDLDITFEGECYLSLYEAHWTLENRGAAAEALRRAEDALKNRPAIPSITWHEARARMLRMQGKHSEAVAEQRLALERGRKSKSSTERVTALLFIASSCQSATRYRESLEACQRALDLNPVPELTLMCYGQMMLAATGLNRLDWAEEYRERIAVTAVQQGSSAGILWTAYLDYIRGRFDEALTGLDGLNLDDDYNLSIIRTVRSEVAVARGEFGQAIVLLNESLRQNSHWPSDMRRYCEGTERWWLAWVYAEAGDVENARANILEATALVGDDEIYGDYCEAVAVRVEALTNPNEPSLRGRLAELEKREAARRAERGGELSATRELRDVIGCAAYACGEWETALRNWQGMIPAGIRPFGAPRIHYSIGECLRNLGRLDEARDAYREAVRTGVDAWHTRLAAERLREWATGTAPDGER